MGAALTYARRYALFTLVGIAGEDDLDAPDLLSPKAPETKIDSPTGNSKEHLNGGQGQSARESSSDRSASASPPKAVLEPERSAELRDRLTIELKDLNSAEEAANWAHRVLLAKNTLAAADADVVEQAFQIKLASFVSEAVDEPDSSFSRKEPRRGSRVVDKSVLALPAPRRIRDREHVKSVAKQACLVCGRCPADAHHLRFAQSRAFGCKVSDEFTVPLCRGHHREVHRSGDEVDWWEKVGIDPMVSARGLWLKTHPPLPLQEINEGAPNSKTVE
jgi:ERF superfamily